MYRNYLYQTHEALTTHRIDWMDVGDDLTVAPLDKEAQWRSASIQLGSCLKRGGIDPTSPHPNIKPLRAELTSPQPLPDNYS
jgi:hypothetical protein